METQEVEFNDCTEVSYKKFKSCDEKDEKPTNQSIRNIFSGRGKTSGNRYYRLAVVVLIVLCVFLISALLTMWVKYNNLNTHNSELQAYNSKLENLTSERNHLQIMYTNMTFEKDQLQASYMNLAMARDQDQTKSKELANEMERMSRNYSTVAQQKAQLQREKNDLQNRLELIISEVKLGWIYFNNSLYFLSNEAKSWTDAREDCRTKGFDLVIIKTKEKQEFFIKKLVNDKAWIGLHDRISEGKWKWVDGTELSNPKFWAPGEPNNSEDKEDCAELWSLKNKKGWNDGPCNNKARWICEKPVSWW